MAVFEDDGTVSRTDWERQIAELEKECRRLELRCLAGHERIEELEKALIDIANHPHTQPELPDPLCHCDKELSDYMSTHGMSEWAIGCVDGHRCAAKIARDAL